MEYPGLWYHPAEIYELSIDVLIANVIWYLNKKWVVVNPNDEWSDGWWKQSKLTAVGWNEMVMIDLLSMRRWCVNYNSNHGFGETHEFLFGAGRDEK